jgi:hypothetical protein
MAMNEPFESEQQKQVLCSMLDWQIGKVAGRKVNGQYNPDLSQVKREIKQIWFDKPIKDLSIEELRRALQCMRTLEQVLGRK